MLADAFMSRWNLHPILPMLGMQTLVIHPASTTHSHISAEAMVEGGLSDDMIRISIGLEDFTDIKLSLELGSSSGQETQIQE